jgi:hypothetical protein
MTELVAGAAEKWWRFRQAPDFVAREIVGPLGVADLVAVQFDHNALRDRRNAGIRPTDDLLALRIIASCRRRSFSVAELAELLGVSDSGVRRAARVGWEAGALVEGGEGVRRYQTHPAWRPVGRRMVAAELKRSDWRRAIHQTWAYQAWANAVWLVLGQRPPQGAPAKLAQAGIGLAYLGEDEGLNVVVRPPRARRLSGIVSVWTAEQALRHALATGKEPGASPKRGPARPVAHLALPGR